MRLCGWLIELVSVLVIYDFFCVCRDKISFAEYSRSASQRETAGQCSGERKGDMMYFWRGWGSSLDEIIDQLNPECAGCVLTRR